MKRIEDFIGKKVMLQTPTSTTHKKLYTIVNTSYFGIKEIEYINRCSLAEVHIINDNGRIIHLLANRFNWNSWTD